MKFFVSIALGGLLLASCRKEEAKSQVAPAPAKKVEPEKKAPLVPQGELPKMESEKAKFIAVPSTPKDSVPKKEGKPVEEVKKAAEKAAEVTK
jgi:PBP1b-binding outer membrane lipoprotein LpoB